MELVFWIVEFYLAYFLHTHLGGDHILFGIVLGILFGIFIVLVLFSIILLVYFRKHKEEHPPQELTMMDGVSTDNNTVDENNEANIEATDKFDPLLAINPVQKPPRLGIPDVSSSESPQ